MGLMHLAARHAQLCLILGLVAGLTLPSVAEAMKDWLAWLVAMLLCLTAYRIGPAEALRGLSGIGRYLGFLIGLQIALPLLAVLVLLLVGGFGTPFGLALMLMLAAPSLTGTPNFAIMAGQDPAPALRLLILGTLVFPLTALPVLALLPGVEDIGAALQAAGRLVLVILGAIGLGLFLRQVTAPQLSDSRRLALDGLGAIALGVVVIGLMSAIGPMVLNDFPRFLAWLAAVMVVNFGLHIATFLILRRAGLPEAPPIAIVAGNRNTALFLIALHAELVEPVLVFIGCYQIPMYLTPMLMKALHRRFPV